MTIRTWRLALVLPLVVALAGLACSQGPERRRGARGGNGSGSDITSAALATYVAPGDLDEYYLFYSGGHSGQVFVAGGDQQPEVYTPNADLGPEIFESLEDKQALLVGAGEMIELALETLRRGGLATARVANRSDEGTSWQPISVDLAAYAGQRIVLRLGVEAERVETIEGLAKALPRAMGAQGPRFIEMVLG